ncbi:MAG: hypothetical protein AAGL17_19455 [Cyanobacteria bacterium J06576_12]
MADAVYSLNQIEGWQSQLQDFAKTPRTRFSKKQAVEALIDDIEAALKSHPYDEVAEKLKDWGLDIAAGSLKQYVNAYRREHGDESGSSARKRSGKKTSKKATVNNSAGRSQSGSDDGRDEDEKTTVNAKTKGADNRAKSATNRTPNGFLEMAEDL